MRVPRRSVKARVLARELDPTKLEQVSGGSLSIDDVPVSWTSRFDDGSSLSTSLIHGDVRTHATPSFDNALVQGALGDCFVVAPINSLMSTPAGRAYGESLISEVGPNQYEVRLQDPYGHPTQVQVPGAMPGGGTGDPEAMILERAIGTVNAAPHEMNPLDSIRVGGNPRTTTSELGLEALPDGHDGPDGRPPDGVVSTVGTLPAELLPSEGSYGLIPSHAYSVVGRGYDPINEQEMLYLSNPHGKEGTLAVPTSAADSLLQPEYSQNAQVPQTAPVDESPFKVPAEQEED